MIRERRGHWHFRFNLNRRTYSGNTGLEATERNRKAAMKIEKTEHLKIEVAWGLAQKQVQWVSPVEAPEWKCVRVPKAIPAETMLAVIRQGADSETCVYFIGSGTAVKIGISVNVVSRLSSLQTASAKPLELLAVVPGGRETESALHSLFVEYWISGEWFRLEGDVKSLVDELTEYQRNGESLVQRRIMGLAATGINDQPGMDVGG